MSGRDPLICRFCGREMDLWKFWHPKYGTIYDEWKNLKAGKYERVVNEEEYSYRCSQCGHEMEVNEVIIDFELALSESKGTCPEGFMPVLMCPHCSQETMEHVRD